MQHEPLSLSFSLHPSVGMQSLTGNYAFLDLVLFTSRKALFVYPWTWWTRFVADKGMQKRPAEQKASPRDCELMHCSLHHDGHSRLQKKGVEIWVQQKIWMPGDIFSYNRGSALLEPTAFWYEARRSVHSRKEVRWKRVKFVREKLV